MQVFRLRSLLLAFLLCGANAAANAAETGALDVGALPFVNAADKSLIAEGYLNARSPKAIAINRSGIYALSFNSIGSQAKDETIRLALQSCEFLAKGRCFLAALDNDLVVGENETVIPIQVSGKFDYRKVPFLPQTWLDGPIKRYAEETGHKAIAISPLAVFGESGREASIQNAKKSALTRCNRAGPGCFIYAVDDDVTFEAGITLPAEFIAPPTPESEAAPQH